VGINNQTIVIFGGTGSIGTVLAEGFLKEKISMLVLVSNNEHELWLAKNRFKEHDCVNYVFCDIRDKEEVEKIFMRYFPELVINAAALKHVNYCEQFPVNTIKTNILGLENLLHGASMWSVHQFVQISTDKAVEPSSVMGASKLIGERLCMQWNKADFVSVSCVRFGNVLGSRGSLVPQLEHDVKKYGKIFLTDKRMKRFIITKKQVWKFIKRVINEMKGGEIFVPKLKEISIYNYIKEVIFPDYEVEVIGKGKAEKLREKMYSELEEVVDIGWALKIKS